MTELFHLMDNMKILILNINKVEGFPKWQLCWKMGETRKTPLADL